ncbi:MAG TPA: GNAT family N-acetyltransferase [Mycobacteriales bacterium]|nr:GNAT family N-acetyltransferase [Mycobacteriales bacterium]
MLRPDDGELGPHDVLDDGGDVLAAVELVDRLDWLQADVTAWSRAAGADAVAASLATHFPGMRVASTEPELVDALVGAGGRIARRGTQLEYVVAHAPTAPEWLDREERDGVRLVDYRPVDDEIASAWLAAYPPTHPDHDAALVDTAAAVADLGATQSGTVTGVFSSAASALAVGRSGEVLGGIMVTLMRPNSFWDGPWVPDLFVRPDAQRRGIGERLVRYAVAAVAAQNEKGLALSVTDGNPARRVYDRVGFRPGVAFASVTIPSADLPNR